MISDKHQCIFIHVPKCAGESIETVFLGGPFNISEFGGHKEKHWSVSKVSEVYPLKYAAYFSFSVIRNPWERMISWVKYRDKRWGRTGGRFETRLWHDLNDDDFIRFAVEHSYVKMLMLNGQIGVNRIIRMENINEGFAGVCDELGLPRISLPHTNKTEHDLYTTYYDDQSRERVSMLFEDDIKVFDYDF